jgi:phage gp37-like protein
LSALVITAAKLGPEQKLFNQILQKIDDCGKSITELNRLIDSHRPEWMAKIAPLLDEARSWETKLVLFLDTRLQIAKGLSKKQRENVLYSALAIGYSLVRSGPVSEELAAAVDRLGDAAGDDDDDDDFFEAHADLGPSGFGQAEPGAFEKDMAEEMLKREAAYEAWREAKEERKSKKKKTAKQLVAEQEGVDADSALRQIYRKLASALHPDREPDEAKRIQKTVLMAQVNAANDKKDLLTMLRLQLQIEQIEPDTIAALADEKLKHYNRMLKDQLRAMQMDEVLLTERIRHEFNLMYSVINAKSLQKALRADVVSLNDQVDRRKFEFKLVQDDKNLKAWAKHQIEMMDMMGDFI